MLCKTKITKPDKLNENMAAFTKTSKIIHKKKNNNNPNDARLFCHMCNRNVSFN